MVLTFDAMRCDHHALPQLLPAPAPMHPQQQQAGAAAAGSGLPPTAPGSATGQQRIVYGHVGGATQYGYLQPSFGSGAPPASPSTAATTARQSERVLLSTASAMAQRSYNEGNYAMAKRLLDSISVNYRHEKWKSILTTILLTALDCAMRLKLNHDAIMYTLELLGGNLLVTPTQKMQLMAQLLTLAASPPVAPSLPVDASAGAAPVASAAPFDVQAHVFEVDRAHGILSAHSHFLTVPSSSTPALPSASSSAASSTGVLVPVSSQRDPFVCVQEEFDLLLTLAVAFPADTTWNRIDVYFYSPPPPPSTTAAANGGGVAVNLQQQPAATPYHLVLLPGGEPIPLLDSSSSSAGMVDRDLPVLRPDASGCVRTDLTFPGIQQGGSSTHGSLMTPSKMTGGAQNGSVFTFGAPSPLPAGRISGSGSSSLQLGLGTEGAPATRTFRVRMKATQATTNNSAALNLPTAAPGTGSIPSAGANAAAATAASVAANSAHTQVANGLHIPGANQALFVTTVVASLAVPPSSTPTADHTAATATTPKALQLKVDVLPSKHEEVFLPSVLLEAQEAERREKEKRAKRKGLPPPAPLVDISLDPTIPARTPTLRILPQHARAHIGLLHPSPALVAEFYPLQISVVSDGDEIYNGGLSLFASNGPNAAGTASGVAGSSPSPTNSPMPPAATGGLPNSQSSDTLGALKGDEASGGNSADPPGPTSLSRASSNFLSAPDSATSAAATAAAIDGVKFYRLTSLGQSLRGRPPPDIVAVESLFEELVPGANLPIPHLAPGGAHTTTVFLRALAPANPTLSITLSYTNGARGVSLGVTSVLNSLSFRFPFKIKTKVFSDALSGLNNQPPPLAATSPQGSLSPTTTAGQPAVAGAAQPQRLILLQPVLLHVELENVSGGVVAIDELGLDLSTKFFRNTAKLVKGSTSNHVLRPCVSPAAAAALREASKTQTHPSPAASSTSASVCLAPGEKYTHLFSFVPLLPGKTKYTPLHIRWNRVQHTLDHPVVVASAAAPVLPAATTASAEDDQCSEESDSVAALPPPSFAGALTPSVPAPSFPSLSFPTPSCPQRKDLMNFHILKAPLGVSLVFPPSTWFGEVFLFDVRIRNATDQMHDVELSVLDAEGSSGTAGAGAGGARAAGAGATGAGSSGAGAAGSHTASHAGHASLIKCVLSGKTRGLLRIRPHATCVVRYRVCPLECGALSLPRIQLRAAGLTTTLSSAHAAPGSAPQTAQSVLLMDPADVGVVFVHPHAKHAGGAQEEEQTSQARGQR